MVPAQYHDFRDVFSKEAFDELPLQKGWDHTIDLTPGTELPHSWTFPLSPAEQKELNDSLRKVNMCKYPPIGSFIILPDDVYKSSKIMLPKEGLCL